MNPAEAGKAGIHRDSSRKLAIMGVSSILARVPEIRLGLILLILPLLSYQANVVASGHPGPPLTNQAFAQMLGQANPESALEHLREVSGEDPICAGATCRTISDRVTGGRDLQRATDHICNELRTVGYPVQGVSWSGSGCSDRIIITRKWGAYAPNAQVYIVAHVDGVRESGGPYPAADDNASGVADLSKAARLLGRCSFDRSLVLFFCTGEEQGSLGAKQYLGHLSPNELKRIDYVVNVDTIGYNANGDGATQLWHGNQAPSLGPSERMSEIIGGQQLNLRDEFAVGWG